jgi:hypothetical protein
MTDLPARVSKQVTADRKAEIERQIEIADQVLWETREYHAWNSLRDYTWLQDERARLERSLRELKGEAKP